MYELIAGLETHIELKTKSKIFCNCPVTYANEPNTCVCPTCLGLPGSLPVLNKEAVLLACKMGLALNCEISSSSFSDRKNYTYPDLAKSYQISQSKNPICKNGYYILSNGRKIRINRIHIEEDAAKTVRVNNKTYIDYNRSGVPLIEIVTEPDFRDQSEVNEYLQNIRLIAKYLNISDCKMQEGSIRCDVNVSVKNGAISYDRCEIKNMNSFSNIIKAINAEFKRQIKMIEHKDNTMWQTLWYDEKRNVTYPIRKKESEDDYRYFKEPDIPPFSVSKDDLELLKYDLEFLPSKKYALYCEKYGISYEDASLIIKYPAVSKFFENLCEKTKLYSYSCYIILTHVFRILSDENSRDDELSFPNPFYVADVMLKIKSKDISENFLNKILTQIFKYNKPVFELFKMDELKGEDEEKTESVCESVLKENEKIVSDYISGKDKALSYLIGLVMKQTKGRADAIYAKNLLLKKIKQNKSIK